MSVKEIEVNVKMMVRGKKTMEFEGSQPIVNVLFLKFPTSFPFWTDHQILLVLVVGKEIIYWTPNSAQFYIHLF